MVGSRVWIGTLLTASLCLAGCGGAQDTPAGGGGDHAEQENGGEHALPDTLAEAVDELAEHRDELAAAFEAEDAAAVDEALHHMDPIARKLDELVEQAELDRYARADADQAATELLEALEALHQPHGEDVQVNASMYEAEADKLNGAMETLQATVEKSGDEAAAE